MNQSVALIDLPGMDVALQAASQYWLSQVILERSMRMHEVVPGFRATLFVRIGAKRSNHAASRSMVQKARAAYWKACT